MTILDNTYLLGIGAPSSLWGTMIWGQGTWGSATALLVQRRLAWTKPLVFKQAALVITIPAANGVAIGNLYMRYEVLGYLLPKQDISGYLLDDLNVPILDNQGRPIMIP